MDSCSAFSIFVHSSTVFFQHGLYYDILKFVLLCEVEDLAVELSIKSLGILCRAAMDLQCVESDHVGWEVSPMADITK